MDDFMIESVFLVRTEHVSGAAKFPAHCSAPLWESSSSLHSVAIFKLNLSTNSKFLKTVNETLWNLRRPISHQKPSISGAEVSKTLVPKCLMETSAPVLKCL